jgi:hypothetical protein
VRPTAECRWTNGAVSLTDLLFCCVPQVSGAEGTVSAKLQVPGTAGGNLMYKVRALGSRGGVMFREGPESRRRVLTWNGVGATGVRHAPRRVLPQRAG